MDWLEVAKVVPTAAVVSAVVTLTIRWLDRPRAVLRLEARLGPAAESMGMMGPATSGKVALLNVGDGDAFDVKVFGSKCDVAIEVEPNNWVYSLASIKAGESAVLVAAASTDRARNEGAAVIVTWSTRPRRWLRKRIRVGFDDVGLAQMMPPGVLHVSEIPKRVRRTRSLEARSPRARLYRQRPGDDEQWMLSHPSDET